MRPGVWSAVTYLSHISHSDDRAATVFRVSLLHQGDMLLPECVVDLRLLHVEDAETSLPLRVIVLCAFTNGRE